jgi:hypothetical protein
VEVNLFLRDIHDFFANNRPVLSSVHKTVKSHTLNGGCRTVGGWVSAGQGIVP